MKLEMRLVTLGASDDGTKVDILDKSNLRVLLSPVCRSVLCSKSVQM